MNKRASLLALAALTLLSSGAEAGAQTLVLLNGYGLDPPLAPPPSHAPDAPRLRPVARDTLSTLFQVDPSYHRASAAHVTVVGAFTITPHEGDHLTAAWSGGFLPVMLSFSSGRCYLLSADYNNGKLFNGELTRQDCGKPRKSDGAPPAPPSGRHLNLVGTGWGYSAWLDRQAGETFVTAAFAKSFDPFMTAHMKATAFMAMNGPDFPGGNITLVGKIHGRQTVVVLEVGY